MTLRSLVLGDLSFELDLVRSLVEPLNPAVFELPLFGERLLVRTGTRSHTYMLCGETVRGPELFYVVGIVAKCVNFVCFEVELFEAWGGVGVGIGGS
jgi:hypothetical protein